MLIKLLFLILTTTVHEGFGLIYNVSLEKELYNQLFNDYNRYILPRYDISSPITVGVSVIFLYLDDVDVKSQTFTVRLALNLEWIDNFLTWDQELYSGVSFFRAPQDIIWTPDIHIYGTVGKVTDYGQDGAIANVYSSGFVNLMPFNVQKISCVLDIRKYPFDVQKCCLDISPWTYHNKSVVILAGHKQIDLLKYQPNGEWQLEVEEAHSYTIPYGEFGYTHAVFPFILRRKWQFVILNTFFPTVCTSLLTLFCFCLPNETGERIGLSISIFLTLAVFMTVTSADLPRTADGVSLLGAYTALQLSWSAMTIVLTVVSLAIAHSKRDIPKWIHRFYMKKCNKAALIKDALEIAKDSMKERHPADQSSATNFTDINNIDNGEISWGHISSELNNIFFYGCLLWHICLHIWFVVQIYT